MIKSISLTNPIGQTLKLILEDPYTTGICVTKIEGLGYPQSSVQKQKITNSNVSIYQGSDKEPRNIVLTVAIFGNPTVESSRHILYNYLWADQPTSIEIETDEIVVHTEGYVETVEPDIFSKQETIQASIICLDPYLYTGGKVFYKSNSLIYGEPNFQFSSEKENNWFDRDNQYDFNQGVYGIPVSISDDLSEDYAMLKIFSRFQNPRGFSITIKNRNDKDGNGESGSFNQVLLSYQNGSILVNSLGNILDEFTQTPSDNFFNNAQLVIENDVYSQGIYLKRDGKMEDILDKCIIYGDYPCIYTGYNYFKCETIGLTKEVTKQPMVINGEPKETLMNSQIKPKGFYFTIEEPAEYLIMDIYINDLTSQEIKPENYVCRLTLRPDKNVEQNVSGVEGDQYRWRLNNKNTSNAYMQYYIKCWNIFSDPNNSSGFDLTNIGTYVMFNGNRLIKEQINKSGEKSWFVLACYSDPSNTNDIETFKKTWISLNIEMSNSSVTNPMNYLHHFFHTGSGNSPGTQDEYLGQAMQARVVVKSIVEKVIPSDSTEIWYQTSYKNNSKDSEIIVEHDEFYDAL